VITHRSDALNAASLTHSPQDGEQITIGSLGLPLCRRPTNDLAVMSMIATGELSLALP
jgi:hypothetical protein